MKNGKSIPCQRPQRQGTKRPGSSANRHWRPGRLPDAETSLRDDVQTLLIPHLEYDVRRFGTGGPLGYEERRERHTFHTVRLERQAAFPAGLVPRVVQILVEHGYQVKIVDHRDFGKFKIDAKFIQSVTEEERQLVDTVRREPAGQIEAKNFADMIEKMRLIVHVLLHGPVLVPVATRKMAWKVQDQLFNEDAGWGVHLRGVMAPNAAAVHDLHVHADADLPCPGLGHCAAARPPQHGERAG